MPDNEKQSALESGDRLDVPHLALPIDIIQSCDETQLNALIERVLNQYNAAKSAILSSDSTVQISEDHIRPETYLQEENVRSEFKSMVKAQLEEKLNSPFRHGSSAFRLGLVPQSVSDHLMISAKIQNAGGTINLASWNMLADEHLYNNFRNVSGSDLMEKALDNALGADHIYHGQMIHLLSEIGEYLYDRSENGVIDLTEDLIKGFESLEAHPSKRTRSRDPESQKVKEGQAVSAREAFTKLLLDNNHSDIQEFRLLVQHSVELISHIKAPEGALRWANRLELLKQNAPLLNEFTDHDIITLQECTSPSDIQHLFEDKQKDMFFISHNTKNSATSTDNVVIAFDKNKYELDSEPLKTSIGGHKPALYARLKSKETGDVFVVGSIHHPGGNADLRAEIQSHFKSLQKNEATPYFIAGDYNHTNRQWLNTEDFSHTESDMFYPKTGSMAGSDFGNTNQGIDAIMAHQSAIINVEVSQNLQIASPAAPIATINFSNSLAAYVEPETLPVPDGLARQISSSPTSVTEMLAEVKPADLLENFHHFKAVIQELRTNPALQVDDKHQESDLDDTSEISSAFSIRTP